MQAEILLPRVVLLALQLILASLSFPLAGQPAHEPPEVPVEAVQALEQARELRRAGDLQTAIPQLTTLVDQFPKYYLARYNLGLAQAQARDLDRSIETLKVALALKESQGIKDPTILNSIGWTYYLKGDLLEAKSHLERAVAQPDLSPGSRAKALNNYGVVLLQLQAYEDAEKKLREAVGLGSPRAESNLLVLEAARTASSSIEKDH